MEEWAFLHSEHQLCLRAQERDSGPSGAEFLLSKAVYSHAFPNKAPRAISCAGVSQGTLIPEG